jgi:hypothetical protein
LIWHGDCLKASVALAAVGFGLLRTGDNPVRGVNNLQEFES